MRTTVIVDDELWPKLKAVAMGRRLSEFINRCLREHFVRQEMSQRIALLEKAYQRAAMDGRTDKDLEALDREDWPEW